jgi:cyclic pyranopterin phosphate synthase
MPAEGGGLVGGAPLLPAEALAELAAWLAAALGIDRVKLTGGEPLVRADTARLVERLAATPGIREVSLTTNGSLLGRLAGALKLAGLARVNISLDSLDAGRFSNLTRGARVGDTLAGIDAALSAGLAPVKLNAVLHRSTWRDDVPQLIGYAASRGLEIRFIELMRTGIERSWPDAEFVPAEEVRRWIETRAAVTPAITSEVTPEVAPAGNPARMTTVDWHGIRVAVGWIMPRSHPFCHACERVRLDARGRLRRCLMDPSLFDLAGARRANGDAVARAGLAAYMDGKRAPGTMDGLRSMSSVGG